MSSIRQLSSGLYRVQVRHKSKGFYRAGSFATLKEAREAGAEWDAQALSAARGGFFTPPKGSTLADLIDRYQELVPETWGRTKSESLKVLRRELGSVHLVNLNAATLRDWVDKRLTTSTGVSVSIYLSTLSAVLQWGKHARRLDLPADIAVEARKSLVHRGADTRGKERHREPTEAELRKLYDHWSTKARQKIPMQTICECLIELAWRPSELLDLQLEQIDMDAGTALLLGRKHPQKKHNDMVVPILGARPYFEKLIGDRKEGPLFIDVNVKSVSTSFTRAVADCKIKDLRLYDLRHLGVTKLLRSGMPVPLVMLCSGHENWNRVKHYSLIKAQDVIEFVEGTKPTKEAV